MIIEGIHKTLYDLGEHQNVRVTKPDGKTFYIPKKDLVMLVATMKRWQILEAVRVQSDEAVLGMTDS